MGGNETGGELLVSSGSRAFRGAAVVKRMKPRGEQAVKRLTAQKLNL
jgi:hypothetical protein